MSIAVQYRRTKKFIKKANHVEATPRGHPWTPKNPANTYNIHAFSQFIPWPGMKRAAGPNQMRSTRIPMSMRR
jgi:hypothetical protein